MNVSSQSGVLNVQEEKGRDKRVRVTRSWANLVLVMREAVQRVLAKQPYRTAIIRSAMQQLFDTALDQEWLLVTLARMPRALDAAHIRASAVAAFTLVLTRRLLLMPGDAVELCMAALFHDLTVLPGETGMPGQRIRSLARSSADTVTDEVLHQAVVALEWTLGPTVAGSTARFVAVPSVFELLTQPGEGRPAVGTDDVMRLMLQMAGQRLDDTVVQLFVRQFGFYPPGTGVRLSDSTHAIVLRPPTDKAPLDQPVVRRYNDKGYAGGEVDLSGEPALYIQAPEVPTQNPIRAWLDI